MSNPAPVIISFQCEGVEAMRGVFASVEQRMVQSERVTTRSAEQGARSREKLAEKERRERTKEYEGLFKQIEKQEKDGARTAKRAADEKVQIAETEAKRKDRIRENSMRMAHSMLLREVADEKAAAEEKSRLARASAESQARAETAMRRRYGRSMGRGVVSGLGSMVGSAISMVGAGLSIGGGFAVADAVRKDMSFSRAVAQASNMSYIPGTTTREQVSPEVIARMSRGTQALTNIDKEDVANGIKRYVGLSSDFEGLAGKTKTGRTGLEELSILSKASGTPFETMMESAASIKANNSGMNSEGLITVMRTMLGAGKFGTIPLDQLASSVGMIQSTASAFAGDQTSNQGNLLGLAQLAGKGAGGNAERAAMAVKDFSGEMAKNISSSHAIMSNADVFAGGDPTKGFLAPDVLLGNLFKKSKGSYTAALDTIGQRAMPLFDALKPVFNDAEAAKKGSGVAAVQAEVKKFESVSYSPEDTMKEFSTVMQSEGERIDAAFTRIREAVETDATPYILKFADSLEKNEPKIEAFLGALSEAADFMLSHPWASLATAMELRVVASIAEASIGVAIKEAILRSMGSGGGGGGGVPGVPGSGGGGGGGGGFLGTLGAAAAIGTIAVATASQGEALIDKAWADVHDRQNADLGLKEHNDIGGIKWGGGRMTQPEQQAALEADAKRISSEVEGLFPTRKRNEDGTVDESGMTPGSSEKINADRVNDQIRILNQIHQVLQGIQNQFRFDQNPTPYGPRNWVEMQVGPSGGPPQRSEPLASPERGGAR